MNGQSTGSNSTRLSTSVGSAGPFAASDQADAGCLRLVMDSMSEGFGLLAPDFTILELNTEAMRIDGRAREDVIGQSHWVAYPGTEWGEVGRLYKKAMHERVPVTVDLEYAWHDGRRSWLEARVFPVENGCLAVFFRDVSEQRLQDQRLRQSERRFSAAVAALDGVLWTNNACGEMEGEQLGWAALTGQSFEQYQGYGWAEAVHPDDAQPTIDAWQAAVAAKMTFDFEHRVRSRDGSWRLCAIRAVPIEDETGTIVEWVGIHRDITRSRADALRLRQLTDTVEAVFYVNELDEGRLSYVSRAYETVWGRPREDLSSDPASFLQVIHPDDRPSVEAAIREQAAGRNTTVEYRLVRDDASERVIHDRAFPTTDPISGARRVVGLASDITDYRRAQDLLERNAETFTNLVVSNPFGIHVWDAGLRLVQFSRGAQPAFAGIDPLIGRPLAEVMRSVWAEPFASEVIERFRHTLATGEPYVSASTVETRVGSGTVEAYDWRIERIVLPDGQYGVVCYFYDLSERNAYEAKLMQALADKDLLAREIDHRVKNSLTIVGSLLSMQRGVSPSEETRSALEEAADRVIAVARVHERLHKSGQMGIVAFGEYLEEMCADWESSMHGRGIALVRTTAAVDLPAEAAMSLALIANELVTNAFKHGSDGGATKVEVALWEDGETVTMSVSDDGAGLPVLPRVNRTSLGLQLVDALARQLNAQTVIPAPGMPARFSVSIPKPGRMEDG